MSSAGDLNNGCTAPSVSIATARTNDSGKANALGMRGHVAVAGRA